MHKAMQACRAGQGRDSRGDCKLQKRAQKGTKTSKPRNFFVLFCDKSAALESPLELTCSAHWHRVFCPIRSGELGRGRKHPIHMSEDLKQFDSARGSRAQKNPRRRASATYLIQQSPA